jgi:hypothetical protein
MDDLPETAEHALIRDFDARKEAWSDFFTQLESLIFQELDDPSPNIVGSIVGQVITHDLLSPSGADCGDAVAEVANLVAAAAAIQPLSYGNLAALVGALPAAGAAQGAPAWAQFPFRVVNACLLRFPAHTHLFLLQLLEAGTIDLHEIYHYLKYRHSDQNLRTTATFLYFLPELAAAEPRKWRAWAADEWKQLLRDRSEKSLLRLLAPREFANTEDLAAFDWAPFRALRAAGRNPSDLLEAIRTDNVTAFLPYVAQHDFGQRIPFSLYEQYFHFDYRVERGPDGKLSITEPTIIDAIALLGARGCFDTLVTSPMIRVDKVLPIAEALERSAASIIACGARTGCLTRSIELGMSVEAKSIQPAVRFHDFGALNYLLDNESAVVSDDAIEAALVYANYSAFELFMSTDNVKGRLAIPGKPALLHYISKGNAITAFKLVMTALPVLPLIKGTSERNFLHTAADAGAYEVVDFWITRLQRIEGLDGNADQKLPAYGIAAARGLHPKPATKGLSIEERKPLYALLYKRTEELADSGQ